MTAAASPPAAPETPRPPEAPGAASTRLDRLIEAYTRLAARRPWRVLLVTLAVLAGSFGLASRLRIDADFVALLPSDSPTAARFREANDRMVGAAATIVVLAESASPEANRRYVDAAAEKVRALPAHLVGSVETGPGEARDFLLANKWLFADRGDLVLLECQLEKENNKALPGYVDLEGDCASREGADDRPSAAARPSIPSASDASDASDGGAAPPPEELSAIQRLDRDLQARIDELDRHPTGYFSNDDGTIYSLLIRARTGGRGSAGDDELLRRVKAAIAPLDPKSFAPDLEVGLAGSIPNAISERDALIADTALVSILAVVLVLASVLAYFRSPRALLFMGLCAATGAGLALALAAVAYGSLNTASSFLGSIIVGNGINYSIIYMARYRERRAGGESVEDALAEAAITCKNATWLAAAAAGGAYAALMVTSFQGFSQFGLVGGAGMVLCWLATFLILPAAVAAGERVRPQRFRRAAATEGGLTARAVRALVGAPLLVTLVGAAVTVGLAWRVPAWAASPLEYDFSNLGSSSSKTRGAGKWSQKSNTTLKTRGSPQLILTDRMDEVLSVEPQLRAAAAAQPIQVLDRVETVYSRLGGPPELVRQKLELLGKIRRHIDRAMKRLADEERRLAEKWRPPERLRELVPDDMPSLLKAQFTEVDGTIGTPVYVDLAPGLSQSDGHNLMKIAAVLESVKLSDGRVAPNAARATVFAAMIRSMERDGPLATGMALLVVIAAAVAMTRRLGASLAVIGSLLLGVLWTIGWAAWLDQRLNFLNFVALPLTFGIGVDYAINLYERIRVTGDVARGVTSVGGAVLLCSATTVIGYGALLFADSMALQSFGRIAIAGELACLATALLVMPAVLHAARPRTAP